MELKNDIVGAGGTTVMTGPFNDFLRNQEEPFEKSLQWFIYSLRLNKFPLWQIYTAVDGPTISADVFFGQFGKQIKSTVSE